jgi:hypothetical protein
MSALVEKEGHLRFLKSCIPSIVVTYWKPPSIRLIASSFVVATLQVHSSLSRYAVEFRLVCWL